MYYKPANTLHIILSVFLVKDCKCKHPANPISCYPDRYKEFCHSFFLLPSLGGIGPSGVRALPLAAVINVGGHYF